jgi:acetyl-CoA acetyltransferase
MLPEEEAPERASAPMERSAIVGIGTVGFGDFSSQSAAGLAGRALSEALADSGLERRDIDGLIVHIGSPRGLDHDEMAKLLGLQVGFASQTWSHGRFGATVLQHAAMVVMHGLANHVVCMGVFRNSAFPRHGMVGFPGFDENFREGGGPHYETPHAGLIAPIGGAALATQRYLDLYGIDREKLGAIAVAQRQAACLNEHAVRRTPLDQSAYTQSPFVVEPLRRLDCSTPVDTGIAVIVSRADRAKDLRQRPVILESFQGLAAGTEEFVFGQPGLGVQQHHIYRYQPSGRNQPVFTRAGLTPEDIDTFHCYDGFSSQVLWSLERFGFAPAGESADWIQGGRIALTGSLPVNTSGGHLSEGHSNGWGHTLEIVRQLRHQAGLRQIADCRTALWGSTFGDAILYRRG